MGKRAFTFPGQGGQAVGMGMDLADVFPEARAVFAEVDAPRNHESGQDSPLIVGSYS